MSESGVIPRLEDQLVSDRPTLTDWHVEGEIECPGGGRSYDVDAPLDDVVKFTALHECGDAFMPP